MPPRKNIARRGRKSATQGRCAGKPAACSAAQQLENSKLAAAIVVVEKLSDSVVTHKPRKADAAIEASAAKKRKLSDTPTAAEPEPTEVEDGASEEEEEEEDGTCEALFLDVDDDEGGSPVPSEDPRADDENRNSAAEEEDSMPAAEKDVEENVDGAAEAEGDEAAPEDDDEGAENVNGEEYTEVDEEIVEEEAEDEAEADESQHCEGEVGEHDGEEAEESQDLEEAVESRDGEEEDAGGEDGAEGEAAENWEAAADGEVEYYEEGDGTPQDAEWDEEMECVDADDAEVVDDVDDAEGGDQECAEDDGGEDHVMDDPAVHDETARDTHDYSAEDAQADGTDNEGNEEATTAEGTAAADETIGDGAATYAEEPTVEVTQMSELCPTVSFEEPRAIAESLRDSIQRAVQLFIEQMLDAKGPEHASMSGQGDRRVYGCSLCNIQIEEPDKFDRHMESTRHTKRLRWLYFMGLKKDIGKFHCRVCHISMSCEDHLLGHLRSERHIFCSTTLNVHPDYSEHMLLQHFSKGESPLQQMFHWHTSHIGSSVWPQFFMTDRSMSYWHHQGFFV
uniref:Putative retinitis pigmentosa gtpase regulator n=1 Tax=Rhipicephalus pulchellus TaxID=72859 RepID=L7LUY2_RHIPC